MKVFISWSGDVSRKIASELYEWLPMVVQSIQPYMSSETIEKGTRWATSIADELDGTSVGIVVLTPDNTSAPWINFEAGALAKVVDNAKLAPVLFGLKPSDVGTPLSQFQVTLFNKGDILKLLKSINACGGDEALPNDRLEKMHDALWDDLTRKVNPILEELSRAVPAGPKKPESETSQVLEELLVLARQQASTLLNPEKLISPDLIRTIVEVASERGVPDRDRRHLRTIVRVLHRRWKDFADVTVLDAGSAGSAEGKEARITLAADFENVLRDLMEFVDDHGRYRTEARRYLSRDVQGGRSFRATTENSASSVEVERELKPG
jgi:hypothetical protein